MCNKDIFCVKLFSSAQLANVFSFIALLQIFVRKRSCFDILYFEMDMCSTSYLNLP